MSYGLSFSKKIVFLMIAPVLLLASYSGALYAQSGLNSRHSLDLVTCSAYATIGRGLLDFVEIGRLTLDPAALQERQSISVEFKSEHYRLIKSLGGIILVRESAKSSDQITVAAIIGQDLAKLRGGTKDSTVNSNDIKETMRPDFSITCYLKSSRELFLKMLNEQNAEDTQNYLKACGLSK